MKSKIHKILGVSLALVFAFTLTFSFAAPVAADEEEWDDFALPDEGVLGDFFMDTDIDGFLAGARAIDGTFWLYVDGLDELYLSDDDGRTWEASDWVADGGNADIVAMTVSSEDADVLYVATTINVWKTEDAGDTWTDLGVPRLVDDEGAGTEIITSIAVGYANGDPHLFVGTEDTGGAGDGEVYYYQDAPFAATWTDLDVAAPDTGTNGTNSGDVYGIAVSPDFENDTLVVAVFHDVAATSSHVIANQGAGIGLTNWDDTELTQDDAGTYEITQATNPVFVEDFDFDDDYEFFVGVSGDANDALDLGGVYLITGMTEDDDFLLDDVIDDIVSLDLVGDLGGTSQLAGTDLGSIWYSTDDGESWDETDKAPSFNGAATNMLVIVDDDFADSGEAWCASDAATKEGGVHLTTDFGATWNGISMLDTDMARAVYDVSFTAGYGEDGAPLFLVTEGGAATTDDSVWKYDGDNWERVWFDITNELDLVEVSPAYADDNTLFIADSAAPEVLRSDDGGADFTALVRDPAAAITAWMVIDDETIIAGSGAGDYYLTTRYGRRTWDTDEISTEDITDFALSPNYASDGTILAGDEDSQVFISEDEGETWDEVGDGVDAGGADNTYVVFDPDYASNDTFYAASDDSIIRCEIDRDEDWGDQDLDSMNADDFINFDIASGLVISDDGTLYAADATAVVLAAADAVAAVAQANADSFVLDLTAALAAETVTLSMSSGAISVTALTNFTVGYVAATGIYTLSAVAAGPLSATATITTISGPAVGIITNNSAASGITNTPTDDDGDASVTTPIAAGAQGSFSLPDVEVLGVAAVTAGAGNGGVARSLNPTDGLADIEWELLQTGFTAGATLAGIGSVGAARSLTLTYGSDNTLWAINTVGINDIWEYTDTLATAVVLSSPANGATGADSEEVTFIWDDLNEDTVNEYDLELNEKEDFSGPDLGEAGIDDTEITIYDLSSGTTYYWRVTVSDPVASRTSAEWSFNTKVGRPGAAVDVRPLPGAQDVILLPTFAWDRVTGIDYYEIEVATDDDFTSVVATGTPPDNTWAIEAKLSYSTVYYWRVRGIAATGDPEGSWRVSIFTTMAAPAAAAPPVTVEKAPDVIVEVPAAPPAVEVIPGWMLITIIAIGAVLVVALIVLIVRTRRVV